MPFLRDIIALIVTPPGDLVYHLITLFAIQIILGIAVGHWNRNRRDPAAIRLLIAGFVFALARAVLMLVAMLHRIGMLQSNVVLPPLERYLDLVTLLLAIWAFLPLLKQHVRLGVMILISSLLIATGVYAAFAALWPQEALDVSYNGYWQERVWVLSGIILLGVAFVASLIRRIDDWSWAACLFAIWLTGYTLQFINPALTESHTAGWIRLANLAALPLVASLVYRRALSAPPVSVAADVDEDVSTAIISILDATQRIENTQDTEAALNLAAPSIAHTLEADMVAIGLPSSDSGKKLRIIALYPSTGTMLAHREPTLLISRYPLLANAIKTGHLQHAKAPSKDPSITALYHQLGFEHSGPLLAQPLVHEDKDKDEGDWLGILLAGLNSQRHWSIRDEQIVQAIGAAITTALVNAPRRGESAKLQETLARTRQLAQQVADLETELEHQRQRAEELATTLRLREEQSPAEGKSEAEIWQREMQELIETRDEIAVELTRWKEQAKQLAHVNESLQQQLTQATSQDTLSLEAELAQLRDKVQHLSQANNDLQQQLAQARLDSVPEQALSHISYQRLPSDILGTRGILISDEEGHILLASQGARYLVGQSRAMLEGTSIQTLFTEPGWNESVSALLHPESQSSQTLTVTVKLDDKAMRAELTRIPDIPGGMGTLAVMLYPAEVCPDPNDMVTSLIQELRTPMTSINSYTDLLLGESVGILGEMQRQFLQRINANIMRMEGLLEDLVRATTIDSEQLSLSPEPVDPIKVIEEAITSLSTQFSERQVGVQMDLPTKLPPIHADRDSLYQIVLRLLSNACQCSQPNTKIQVHARLEEYSDDISGLPNYLFMSVTDTGGGIAPEDQRRVFQRLYRADNPLIDGLGDTGVGLSVAKALVETQGGRIWVESEKGEGSTFSFILPLGTDQKSNQAPDPLQLPSLPTFPDPDPSPGRVDDDTAPKREEPEDLS